MLSFTVCDIYLFIAFLLSFTVLTLSTHSDLHVDCSQMEAPVDNTEDLFKDYDVTETDNSGEYEEGQGFPSIKINAVTSIPQEEFPALEIRGATSITEAAFMDDPSNGDEEDDCMTEAVEITAMESEVAEEEEALLKEQEPVNEVEEDQEEGSVVVKRESDEGDDGPNEDPNRDNTDSDTEIDPEIAAALKVDNFAYYHLCNYQFRPLCWSQSRLWRRLRVRRTL